MDNCSQTGPSCGGHTSQVFDVTDKGGLGIPEISSSPLDVPHGVLRNAD